MAATPGDAGLRPAKSFCEVLKGLVGSDSGKIKYDFGNFKGSPALFISDEDMLSLAEPFALTLIGKFASARPPLAAIRKFVIRMKFSGLVNVDLHDNFNVVFRFAVDSDYNRFFVHRYYTVFGVNMKVIKWSPYSDFSKELPIVPLWFCFPGLRLQMFDKKALMFLGKIFGNPLSVDSSTARCDNMTKARILVEVDVSLPIPDRVWIGSKESGYFQPVIVENKPPYCGNCKIFGHEEKHYAVGSQEALMNIPKELDVSNLPRDNADIASNAEGMDKSPELGEPGEGVALEEGEIHVQVNQCEDLRRGSEVVVSIANPAPLPNATISLDTIPLVVSPPTTNRGPCNSNATNPPQEYHVLALECSYENIDKGPTSSFCGEVLGIENIIELEASTVKDCLGNTGDKHVASPLSEGVEALTPKDSNFIKAGYPVSGMTTRARSKPGGVGSPGRGGGAAGGKLNSIKGKHKASGAMAIALDALLYPPDFYA